MLYDKIKSENNIIVLMKFGSHLYGTNTENSDTDLKGIYMPTKEQIYLNNIPKSIRYDSKMNKSINEKNTKNDIDCELYSLHYFIKLACEGETAALDILHVNQENLIYSSSIFENLIKHRQKFLTKNLKSFVGYARKQAAKYGLKGSRISDAEKVINILNQYNPDDKLNSIKNLLPKGEHIHIIIQDNEEFYQVCGKKLQYTSKIKYCLDILYKFIEQYGHRAKLAKENEGVDFKAISHAFRAAYQTKELLLDGEIKYPLKQADFLRQVKIGKLNFNDILPKLENLLDEIEELSVISKYPEKADMNFFNKFIIETCEQYLK